MKHLFMMLLVMACMCTLAQEKQPVINKPVFHSINQLGILEGQAGSAFQIQTINGVRFKNYFIGAGAGLDYYVVRSVPVFLDLRRFLLSSGNLMVYGDGGLNFIWEDNKTDWPSTYTPGFFYELGLGYRVPFKGCAFLISGGYSYKRYEQEQRFPQWCINPPCPEEVYKYNHQLRRISMKVGISF